ncbi:unnamed protein product [Nippostrongylus brasiliensis]|uniref:Glycogen [starch] synthase n=1 Tax=Nippostrongylus brasiliensis TaxID=27835 RepID=A0A0N4YN29_NIPBR|nr:unnamed protein product [Nippostrongylus brasiliensis]
MSGSISPASISRKLSTTKIVKQLAGISFRPDDVMDQGETARREGRYVFECSWEVANKVGGIYTVLRTKAPISTEELGDQYCMMGPYFEDRVRLEVEVLEPDNKLMKAALDNTRAQGFKVVYGRWLIDGYPKVVLFDIGSAAYKLDQWKKEMWSVTRVGVPWDDRESNDCIILGFMVATFLQKFAEATAFMKPLIVGHFHEWQAAAGLIMSRLWKLDISLVFTTHATLLGRHLCAGGVDLYNNITNAQYLLGRKPDILTPNGLNVVKFAALHEFQNLHANLDFDLDKTLYFFTAGRYEFTNKGGDFFIEALARLNYKLQNKFNTFQNKSNTLVERNRGGV